ncbi:MAG: VWA domain-containing protein [Betaproteobacteria bacterium]|nr:VWA domain-containing protein [Betaproteobacteria bacterium]MDH5210207.1 VWA domain-containing protein [Betaproteobacteria bacterium]
MLEFAWPFTALALVLPWLAMRFVPPAAPLATPLRVPFLGRARAWSQAGARARPRARVLLALAAWALLVAAACRPQWIGEPVGVPSSGRSMLLALDVSASMRTAALGSELGLEVMRRTARQFVAARPGDRIGLVVFGSKAYVQSPLTFDLKAVAEMVDETFIGLAGEGTALGDAVALGVARLRAMQRDERVLILLTDGSSTDGTVTVPDAARLARLHGVRVHAIGIGTPRTEADLRPGEGLDENALKLIAAESGGRYFRAENREALERIYEALERVEPTALDERHYRPTGELYAWPLALALALALAAMLAGAREARP